jgi:hypothetical protein
MMTWRRRWKWFGYLSTLTMAVAALAPDALRIPHNMQAWVFLAAVMWFFTFTTGFFNS